MAGAGESAGDQFVDRLLGCDYQPAFQVLDLRAEHLAIQTAIDLRQHSGEVVSSRVATPQQVQVGTELGAANGVITGTGVRPCGVRSYLLGMCLPDFDQQEIYLAVTEVVWLERV